MSKRSITKLQHTGLLLFAKQAITAHNTVALLVSDLYPTNFNTEQKKFFASDTYNPQYYYKTKMLPPQKSLFNPLWRELLLLQLPDELESYFESLLYHFARVYDATSHIGTEHFPTFAQEIYPFTKEELNTLLYKLPPISFAKADAQTLYSAYDIQGYFRDYVDTTHYLNEIDVIVDQFNEHTIRAGVSKLYVGASVKRSQQNMVRLIVHEIESHLLQRQNLLTSSPLLLLRSQLTRELYAEGMAIYNEVTTGTITKSAYDMYFYRLKAVSYMDLSFRDIYTELRKEMSKDRAFLTTFRVKRGMSDTGKPGGFGKDAVYLMGYQAVSQYLSGGGNMELLYRTQVPQLGELLLKYNLLPKNNCKYPSFLQQYHKSSFAV